MEILSIKKEKIKEMLNKFPEDIAVDEIIDQIIILAKIEKALEQLANGEYLTSEQVDDEINKW